MKNIIVLGDSHGSIYQYPGNQLSFVPLGPVTIFNLLKDEAHLKLLAEAIDRMDPAKEIPIIVLGEVDCRIHVYLQHKKTGRGLLPLIWDTAVKYIAAVDYLIWRGFETGVHGIPPATTQGNIFNYPHYADLELHGLINMEYNFFLQCMAQVRGIPFFDAYMGYGNADGVISEAVSEDGCHISPNRTGIVNKFVNWVRKEVESGI